MKRRGSGGKTVSICKVCGDEFIGPSTSVYCSKECAEIQRQRVHKEQRKRLSTKRKTQQEQLKSQYPLTEDVANWIGYTLPERDFTRYTNVYFIHCEQAGRIKIGSSTNVNRRLSGLQTACPLPLELLLAINYVPTIYEYLLHERFKEDREHGEWFVFSDKIKTFVEEASGKVPACNYGDRL